MGVGVLADRPSPGVPGVGWWATDTKKLYKWTSNNGWEESILLVLMSIP
jgi:hypothetical protein